MSLAPDVLASQSRAPKTRIRVKNAKYIWDKKWLIWPEPRVRKPSLKLKNTLPLWRRQWKTPNSTPIFFSSMSGARLAESIEGLNASLALAPGKVWLCKLFKYFKQKFNPRDWKGLANSSNPLYTVDFRKFIWIYLLWDTLCWKCCKCWNCQIQETGRNVRIHLTTDAVVSIQALCASWNTLERNGAGMQL